MKTALITQARMGSSRLPGKVLKKILGRPILELFIERARRISNLDEIIVATSQELEDDEIALFCQARGISCFRGSAQDVLSRYYECAKKFKVDHIVRITSDCPLLDPEVSAEVIHFYLTEKKWDYISNNRPAVYPHGLDTEIFSFIALEKSHRFAKLAEDREHVSSYITEEKNSMKFRGYTPKLSKNFSHHRWTLDYPEDYEMIKRVFEELYPHKPAFSWLDVIKLLEAKPEIFEINRNRALTH